MRLALLFLTAATAFAACAVPLAPLPPAPQGLKAVAIARPDNATGQDLAVNEVGFLSAVLDDSKQTSVPQLLENDLRFELGDKGFAIVKAGPGAPVFRTEIRRWSPFAADYSHVTVDISASLVEPDGRIVWSVERTGWAVPTSGSGNEIDATIKASHKVASDLVADWQGPVAAAAPE